MPVEKRRVTMTNQVLAGRDDKGDLIYHTFEATDYVPLDILDVYVEEAKTRWSLVEVDHDAGHDPGPAGDNGDTHYPAHLDHPLAGQTIAGGA